MLDTDRRKRDRRLVLAQPDRMLVLHLRQPVAERRDLPGSPNFGNRLTSLPRGTIKLRVASPGPNPNSAEKSQTAFRRPLKRLLINVRRGLCREAEQASRV